MYRVTCVFGRKLYTVNIMADGFAEVETNFKKAFPDGHIVKIEDITWEHYVKHVEVCEERLHKFIDCSAPNEIIDCAKLALQNARMDLLERMLYD